MSFQIVTRLARKIRNTFPAVGRVAHLFLDRATPFPAARARELSAVSMVLQKGHRNPDYGPDSAVSRLEQEFAEYVGANHAIAVNTGGMGLQVTMRALGLRPGDEVIHQIDTCVANAFSVFAAGATPIFSDIDPDHFMVSLDSVKREVTPRTRAILGIHLWGNPMNLDGLLEFAAARNIDIIEDACLSLGARFRGQQVGIRGKAGVFSFGCLKPIQTGEGGMIVTQDAALAREMRCIRSWGEMLADYGVRDQQTLSWNGRMSEIIAAVALEQLRAYGEHLNRLRSNVDMLREFFNDSEGIELAVAPSSEIAPAFSQLVLRIDENRLGISKRDFMQALQRRGVSTWHANFELINSCTFFRTDRWKDWVVRGDLARVERNYRQLFPVASAVYEKRGVGISKAHLLTARRVKHLISSITEILSHRERIAA